MSRWSSISRGSLTRWLLAFVRRPALFGMWEEPGSTVPGRAGDVLSFKGWALARRSFGRDPRIEILADAKVVAELPARDDRPDVRAAHGPGPRGGGWEHSVSVPLTMRNAEWQVVATLGRTRQSLGSRSLGKTEVTSFAPIGDLDSPTSDVLIDGAVVKVEGWTLFHGADVDSVMIWVDDGAPTLARVCLPRPDVRDGVAGSGLRGFVTGFSQLIPAPANGPHALRVRAIAMDGQVWDAPAVHLQVQRMAFADPTRTTSASHWLSVPAPVPLRVGPPRVAVFTHSLGLGGGELYLQELLLRLAKTGAAEALVLSPSDGPLRGQLEAAGHSVLIFSGYEVRGRLYGDGMTSLVAVLRAWGAEVVIGNTLGVFPGVDAALNARIPVIWAVHESFDLGVFSFLNWGHYGLEPAVEDRLHAALAGADVVFEAEATLALFKAAVPSMRGRCLRYGIDLAEIDSYCQAHPRSSIRTELDIHPETRVLLCMGVFQERKGQLALVSAFAKLSAAFPDAQLVLVGDHRTSYSAAIHQYLEDSDLAGAVRLVDLDPDTYRWYRAADVMISASDVESLPRSVLEAAAFGLPTLAADVFGLREVIEDGRNGWLFQAGSGAALIAAMRRVLELRKSDLDAAAQECMSVSASHDGRHYAAAYAEIIAQLAQTRENRGK